MSVASKGLAISPVRALILRPQCYPQPHSDEAPANDAWMSAAQSGGLTKPGIVTVPVHDWVAWQARRTAHGAMCGNLRHFAANRSTMSVQCQCMLSGCAVIQDDCA